MKVARLKQLRSKPLLPSWEGEVPAGRLAATRKVLLAALDKLIALGSRGKPEAAQKILARAVERLNKLDEQDQFICTIEREDLCDWFYEVGELCGIDPDEDWVDDYRDW
jgi:hypothetical protein